MKVRVEPDRINDVLEERYNTTSGGKQRRYLDHIRKIEPETLRDVSRFISVPDFT